MAAPVVFYFRPFSSAAVAPSARRYLHDAAFHLIECDSAAALQNKVQAHRLRPHSAGAGAVVLDGSPEQMLDLIARLHNGLPHLGLVCLLPQPSSTQVAQCLLAGADLCCPSEAPAVLIHAALLSVLRRCRPAAVAPDVVGPDQDWRLKDKAWLLQSPCGGCVALTTHERAFLLELTHHADLRADHASLLAALDSLSEKKSVSAAPRRLGVLVNRLKRKCFAQHGVRLPLKSLHAWGYMFAGNLRQLG